MDYRINIHLKTSKFTHEPIFDGDEPLIASRRPARKTGIAITLDGQSLPQWATKLAIQGVNDGLAPNQIAHRIWVVYHLSTEGRNLTARYPGHDTITGEDIQVGEPIIYCKKGITRPESLRDIMS